MPMMPGMSMAAPPSPALNQFYLVLAALAMVFAVSGILARPWLGRLAARRAPDSPSSAFRNLLAFWLGALWLFDGLLQMQPQMTTRFVGGFLAPLLSGQPGFVRAVIQQGIHLWSLSPVWFNVGAAMIQLLIGITLLFTRDGVPLRRYALYVSLGWGLVVWSVGEGFGSLFAGGGPLSGSPGSVFLYMVAAFLLLLPESTWSQARMWRWLARGIAGNFFLMAVLAALPSNGWWGKSGATFVLNMGQMPQPAFLSHPLLAWAASYAAHPIAWNAAIVASSLILGVVWMLRRPGRGVMWATIAWTVLVWYFGQDFGVMGGMGTDPNTGAILLVFAVLWGSRFQLFGHPAAQPVSDLKRVHLTLQ